MLIKWSIVFLLIAIIFGVLGFSGLAKTSVTVAKLLFAIFLIMFVIAIIMQW